MTASNVRAEIARTQIPQVPLTIEGSSVLHQMMRFRWSEWRKLSASERQQITAEAAPVFEELEKQQSAVYSMLGHKGDFLFLHFRNSFDELNQVELRLAKLRLWDFLESQTSYVSMVELGLYDSSVKIYEALLARGVEPNTDEWTKEIQETLNRQRDAMRPRLYPEIPPARYLCFYPMDRKRGEAKNWYTLPIEERQRQMHEHGMVGRRYAGEVRQIITGSIGFDDWEWGVDLFADDPLVFKKLIYEMRFDEVSAIYAAFGSFFVGVRCPAKDLSRMLDGELPPRQ
ncbi:MAG TPA: hydrogen peroxide-dependent heme synthase [Terriglobales bacterium]|nr:hydrogen peroxide-dependent heme synthase [Terriglobales bacterium]